MYIILVTWVLHTQHSENRKWKQAVEVYPKPKFYVLSSDFLLLGNQLAVLENRHEKSDNHIDKENNIGNYVQDDVWPLLNFRHKCQSKWEYESSDDLENQEDNCVGQIDVANQWEKTLLSYFSVKISFHV